MARIGLAVARINVSKGAAFAGSLIIACLFLATSGPARAADSDGLCSRIRPLVGGGYSTVLHLYGEAGIRCPSGPWTLQVGWRYTQLEQAADPFAVLSYDTRLSPEWTLSVTASTREHLGDYEVNRMPEVNLQWTPPYNWFLIPSVGFSAGWIETVLPSAAQTVRTGGVFTLSTQPFRVAGATLAATYQTGEYFYGTGQNSSYWLGVLTASIPFSSSTVMDLGYIQQGGFGVSPLLYDFAGYDQYVLAGITVTVNPDVALRLGAQVNISVPTYPGVIREYTLTYTKIKEGWSVGVGWYVPTNQPFVFGTLPP